MKVIRSQSDAYTVASEIFSELAHGAILGMNGYNLMPDGNGSITIDSQEAEFIGCSARFGTPSELASIVLFPNRKRVNDWIRTYNRADFWYWINYEYGK